MLILKDRLENASIMSLQTGTQIAQTSKFIIDPRQLKVVGFYCNGPHLDVNPAILNVSDIREIGSLGIIVDSADVLMSPDDLVRLQEVLNFNFLLENKQVINESGHRLGHVANFTLESTTLYVAKLHVRPPLLQSLKTTELIVDRTQIVEVTDMQIVVHDATTKDATPLKTPTTPILDNPFRRPQAEGTTVNERDK